MVISGRLIVHAPVAFPANFVLRLPRSSAAAGAVRNALVHNLLDLVALLAVAAAVATATVCFQIIRTLETMHD